MSEYNRRAAVIDGVRAGRTPSEIIKFFRYPRSTVYDIVQRYAASEESEVDSGTPERKIHVREKATRTPELIRKAQDLISKDPGTSLTKLAAVLESFSAKLALRQCRYVLVEGFLTFQ
ncbi:hypothetical protein X777_11239 [Ooceraea biroi]|uniref:Paired domain-containing protein n=1 Tax=Ooceraea biroi TaxID=2015173 RepID=A0A026W3J4_OOCBI|nr:hypothetical protein X777_11239 [Ooceraea biroi]